MSNICPLCNGLWTDNAPCPTCKNEMLDAGRYMDFFDDYSPYLQIEGMKKMDGVVDDLRNDRCPHVFECPSCGEFHLREVNEIEAF